MEGCGRICGHRISVEVIRGHWFEEKIVQMRPYLMRGSLPGEVLGDEEGLFQKEEDTWSH